MPDFPFKIDLSQWPPVALVILLIALAVVFTAAFVRWRRSPPRSAAGRPLFPASSGLGGLRALIRRSRDDEKALGELEEHLITADLGVRTTEELIAGFRDARRTGKLATDDAMFDWMRAELGKRIVESSPALNETQTRPVVIFVVGVNGVGKTTTVGKLVHHFRGAFQRPFVIAADTFRFAAIEQLRVWADRTDAGFFSQKEGAAPSGVVFDGLRKAISDNADLVLVDCAGRLHTKRNLMDELKKMKRVAGEAVLGAPHEVWIVLDATLGQNSFTQVREFHDQLGLTGLILTKMDGTSRGGIVVGASREFQLPVLFLGTGEKLSDLEAFSRERYLDALFPKAT